MNGQSKKELLFFSVTDKEGVKKEHETKQPLISAGASSRFTYFIPRLGIIKGPKKRIP